MANYGVSMLRAGRQYDYECSRSTSRLRMSWAILKTAGVEPPAEESDDRLPEWVTDEVLKQVWTTADALIGARGSFNRRAAEKARSER